MTVTTEKKKRADKTPNEFRFLSEEGLSHVLHSANKEGQSVDQIVTRLKSWKVGEVNPEWIADSCETKEGPYLVNPLKRDDDTLGQRFSLFCSSVRLNYQKMYDDFQTKIVPRHTILNGSDETAILQCMEEMEEQGFSSDAIEYVKGMDIASHKSPDDKFPTLVTRGTRESTSKKVETIFGIDFTKLKAMSVVKAGR